MEPAEKEMLIEKIRGMSEEQVVKVLIFIAGLEAGNRLAEGPVSVEGEQGKG